MKKKINFSDLGNRLAFAALEVLRKNDGSMSLGDLLTEVYNRKSADIPPEAREVYDSGGVRWKINTQFQSDIFVKAGFLRKTGGVWHLTAEGANALKLGESAVIEQAKEAYRKWHKQREAKHGADVERESFAEPGVKVGQREIAEAEDEERKGDARKEVIGHIRGALDWNQFQNLCAALLRGMKYHVRGVASPGPDGGIDIIAYTDPLGGRPPRLKVQVKHQSGKVGKPELSQLAGLLTDGDIGVFVCSGGFVAGCRDFARNSGKHLELIDMERLVDLWLEHYDDLSEEDKAFLPLQSVYFLDKKRTINE